MSKVVTRYWDGGVDDCSSMKVAMTMQPGEILTLIERSGLKGRGGASFPAAEKWRQVAGQDGEKYIVANFSNCDDNNEIIGLMIRKDVISAIEGLIIAAYAVGAPKGYIFLRLGQETEKEIVDKALVSLRGQGLLGVNILEMGFSFDIELFVGQHESEKGQQIFVLNAIAGELPVTKYGRNHVTEAGLFGKPTVYHSMETLACVTSVIDGRYIETKMVQVRDGTNGINSIFEAAVGTPIGELLKMAGVDMVGLKAFTVGGSMGALFTPEQTGVTLNADELISKGAIYGNTVIDVLRNDVCIIEYLRKCYICCKLECCGRCVFGRMGTQQIFQILTDIGMKRGKSDDIYILREVAQGMKAASSCSQGQVAANLILSALDRFEQEFDEHIKRSTCQAMRCPGYVTYHILPEKCTGCSTCLKACELKAIEGEDDYIHVINTDFCTNCGICYEVCLEDAIVMAGNVKPKTPTEPIPVGSWRKNDRYKRR